MKHAGNVAPARRDARGTHLASRTYVSQRTLVAAIFGSFLFLVAPLTAVAQEERPLNVDVEAGWLGFPDEGIVSEGMVGAAARWHLGPRISLGPEVLYVGGSSHSHLIVTGNVRYDFRAPGRQSHQMIPFVVAGGGLFQTRETLFNGDFTSTEGAFTAGGGVMAAASDRVTIGIDTRVGWELHLRVNGFVGVRLGR